MVLVVALVAGVVWYMQGTKNLAKSQAWQDFYTMLESPAVVKAETLQMMAGQQSDPDLNALIYVKLGDTLRNELLLIADADRAATAEKAKKAYQTVISNYAGNKYAVTLAKMGLALLHENVNEWDQAKELYLLLKDDPQAQGMGIAAMAADRVENLDQWRKLAREVASTQPTTKPAETLAK